MFVSCRATNVCSYEAFDEEKRKVFTSLKANGFSRDECVRWWHSRDSGAAERATEELKGSIPYVRGVSERIRNVLKQVGVNVGMKPTNTPRNIVEEPWRNERRSTSKQSKT